jgi:hypothetical protein
MSIIYVNKNILDYTCIILWILSWQLLLRIMLIIL